MSKLLLLLLALLRLPCAHAQNATGAIHGTVFDPNGAVIPNAVVTCVNKDTAAIRKVIVGHEGAFTFENLLPGEYEVRVEHPGFTTQVETAKVEIGATVTATFHLSLGATSQTIEVSGAANIVNTSDSALGGIVHHESIENLPLNGRSFLSIAMLEPGVSV